jgi:hypothetical protein
LKGQVVVVEDVLANQATLSGLKLKIRLLQYNPASPFQTHHLDYDDLREET